MISVDVVVVNWNGSAVLGDCLRSLLVSADRSSRAVTITVVDNGSVDDSVVLARAVAPSAASIDAATTATTLVSARRGRSRLESVNIGVSPDRSTPPDPARECP